MKLATYIYENKEYIGVLNEEETKIICINDLMKKEYLTMLELIESFDEEVESRLRRSLKTEEGIDIEKITLISPIPEPKRGVICLGKNYKEHVKEVPTSMDLTGGIPQNPVYFCKFANRMLGSGEDIFLNEEYTNELDYEVELAIIIGKEGKDIAPENAYDYIFGYSILNDISARNLQATHFQWFKGKCLDNTCPMGPFIVHKSQIDNPQNLNISCFVNEELRQNSNTKEMIFDIPYIISNFSRGTTLKKGDIISTGTPSGVGMGFKPEKFLKSGDVISCEIQHIGKLINKVK